MRKVGLAFLRHLPSLLETRNGTYTSVVSNWARHVGTIDQSTNQMNADNYKALTKTKNVLDHGTLKLTIKELDRISESRLIHEIERIIKDNKIAKPTLHQKQDDLTSEYYTVDLTADDIDAIVLIFGDREVESLGPNYETTSAASLYATTLDKWNRILID